MFALFGSSVGLAVAQTTALSQTLIADGVKITFPSAGYEQWLTSSWEGTSVQMADAVTGQPVSAGYWNITLASPGQTEMDLLVNSNGGGSGIVGGSIFIPRAGTWMATGIEPVSEGSSPLPTGYTAGELIPATSNALTVLSPPAPYHVTVSPTTFGEYNAGGGGPHIPSSELTVSITDPSGNRPPDGVYGLWFGTPGGSDEWQIAVSNGEVPIWNCWNASGTAFLDYPAGEWATGEINCFDGNPNYGWGVLGNGDTYQVVDVTLPSNSPTYGNYPGGQTVPATSNSFQVAATVAGQNPNSRPVSSSGSAGGTSSGGTSNTGAGSSQTSGATTLSETMNTLSQLLAKLSQTNATLYTQALAILNQLIKLLGGTGGSVITTPITPSPTPSSPTSPPAQSCATTYSLGNLGANAYSSGIAFDGTNMWTSNMSSDGGSVTKITPSGVTTTYPIGAGLAPEGIAFDGTNMWTANYSGSVTKITPSGATTTYSVGGTLYRIAFDGTNMWTTNVGGIGGSVTKITPTGAATTYSVGAAFTYPEGIAFDGTNMWTANYVISGGGNVTKITPSGVATTYPIGLSARESNIPLRIAFDGTNMWTANGLSAYVSSGSGSVTKITPSGAATTYSLGAGINPAGIAFDGTNMWTMDGNSGSVTEITPSGAMTTYSVGAVGPSIAFDGTNMWTESSDGVTKIAIGACSLSSSAASSGTTASTPSTSFSYTWNTDLQYGMYNNADVSALQQALTLQGVYSGPVTGNFLSATEDAVVLLQQKYGIPGTGYVGPQTRAELNTLYGRGQVP